MLDNLVKEYTVSEIVKNIKNTLEGKYFYIKIKGEISNLKKHTSGHFYFSLKDDEAMINIVMFKQYADFCKIDLNDGLEIIVTGKLTIYKERSNYQLLAELVQISGIGTILKLIQERKEKLAREGLFDIERKKQLPKFPKTVALITAESGAAIQDIISRLKDRTPVSLILYSVLMQGKNAVLQVIKAINYFNNLNDNEKPQIIVITRGGGSIEDLMAFNDENLVRIVANSEIPIISAIGHEVDWTLIDYASDLRLPTPTSVAEYLTISKEQAYRNLEILTIKLYSVLSEKNLNNFLKLNELINNYILERLNNFFKRIYYLKSFNAKLKNIFRIFIERYRVKYLFLKNIDMNKIIKEKYLRLSEKIKIFELKIKNYENKFPVVKDFFGNLILLKSDLVLNENYIIKFADGEVKVKML